MCRWERARSTRTVGSRSCRRGCSALMASRSPRQCWRWRHRRGSPHRAASSVSPGVGASTTTGRTLDISFIGAAAGNGPCTADYAADALESKTAVAISVRATRTRSGDGTEVACTAVGYLRHLRVRLTVPLRNRVLVDAATKGPGRGHFLRTSATRRTLRASPQRLHAVLSQGIMREWPTCNRAWSRSAFDAVSCVRLDDVRAGRRIAHSHASSVATARRSPCLVAVANPNPSPADRAQAEERFRGHRRPDARRVHAGTLSTLRTRPSLVGTAAAQRSWRKSRSDDRPDAGLRRGRTRPEPARDAG